jgi:malate dehydrogenase (oxaloacetate-decarboxylating)
MAASFGGINLEDIAAPICFEVEKRLKEKLTIPIMHDDQHGTAIVTLAALINAMKVTGRKLSDCRIVLVGAGAAGVAIAKLIYEYAQPTILAVDSKGILSSDRSDLNDSKKRLLKYTNPDNKSGSLADAIKDADIFIGVSHAGILTADMVKTMRKDPIIMAMANPTPEIMPDEAKKAGARIVATGRSDFPNQINNALAFPGVFRGALDHRVRDITEKHKLAAAEVIAGLVDNPDPEHIVPDVFDERLVPAIAAVII